LCNIIDAKIWYVLLGNYNPRSNCSLPLYKRWEDATTTHQTGFVIATLNRFCTTVIVLQETHTTSHDSACKVQQKSHPNTSLSQLSFHRVSLLGWAISWLLFQPSEVPARSQLVFRKALAQPQPWACPPFPSSFSLEQAGLHLLEKRSSPQDAGFACPSPFFAGSAPGPPVSVCLHSLKLYKTY